MVFKGGFLSTPVSLCLSLFPSPDPLYHPFLPPPPCPPSTLHFYTNNTQCREIRMGRKKLKLHVIHYRLVSDLLRWLYKYATFNRLMHLLTPGDVIPDMDFLGQKGCTQSSLRILLNCSPQIYLCLQMEVMCPKHDLASRIYCGCSFVTVYAG